MSRDVQLPPPPLRGTSPAPLLLRGGGKRRAGKEKEIRAARELCYAFPPVAWPGCTKGKNQNVDFSGQPPWRMPYHGFAQRHVRARADALLSRNRAGARGKLHHL